MDTYNSCAKKYFYRYVEKVNIEKVKWPWTEFGSCAHLILNTFTMRLIRKPHKKNGQDYEKGFVKAVKEFALEDVNADQGTPDGKQSEVYPI